MATFTYTVSVTLINVTAGTGTLEQLYQDLAISDPGVMTRTGADPYAYVIQGNRELQINAGVVLNCTNDGDSLGWNLTANKNPVFDLFGGTINCGTNFTFYGDTNVTYFGAFLFRGICSFQGTLGNEVIIRDLSALSIPLSSDLEVTMDWDHVKIVNALQSGGDIFSLLGYNFVRHNQDLSFNYITIDDTLNRGDITILYCDCSRFEFSNWNVDGIRTFQMLNTTIKFTNSTFENIPNVSYPQLYFCGASAAPCNGYNHSGFLGNNGQGFNQSKLTFDGCTFNNNVQIALSFGAAYGGLTKCKDCTFSNNQYGARAAYNGLILWEGTQTFTNITTADRNWLQGGSHMHVYPLTLTVYEADGVTPVENAVVLVEQKEGNEKWQMLSDSNGQVKDVHGDDPVFVYQEETSTGVYDTWSDGTGNQIHVISIYKEGVGIYTAEVAFNQARIINASLEQDTSTATKIYDSTIYDSTIY